MEEELKGFFDLPIEEMNIVRRDSREDIGEELNIEDAKVIEASQEPIETPTPEIQAPVETPAPAQVDPVQVQTPVSTPVEEPEILDWKQVLKNEGYDDFALGLLEYYKSTGDITPYLEAKAVDYSALDDAEILRRDLRSKYQDLSDDEFALMYKKKVIDQYGLDESFTEDEQRLGKIELKYAAKEVRDRLIEQQKNFKAPERQGPPDNSQAAQQWKQYVDSDPITQQILSGKRITIGDGEQAVNFELNDVNAVLEQTYNPQKFFESFVKPDGTTDMAKWYKVIAFASNPQAYEKTSINYGKTLGRQEIYNDIKNPPKPDVGQTPGGGTGNFKEDLLNEFLKSGQHRGR